MQLIYNCNHGLPKPVNQEMTSTDMNHTEVKQMVSPDMDKSDFKIAKYPIEKEMGNFNQLGGQINPYKKKLNRD